MNDTSHLSALRVRLSHEKGYLAQAKADGERELRRVWIAQIEREIEREKAMLFITDETECDMSDDELIAALAE